MNDASQVFISVYLESGWARILPAAAIEFAQMLAFDGPSTRSELHKRLFGREHSLLGLDAAAWEPLHDWMDEELRKLDADFADTPLASDREESAVEVMASEAARRVHDMAVLDSYSTAISAPAVRTFGDLLDFMVASQVISIDGDQYFLNPSAPLPSEVLPLSPERTEHEDQLRWTRLHEKTAQGIIGLFRPDDFAPADKIVASLAALAERLDSDTESVRAALNILFEEGDFSSTTDTASAMSDEVFQLRVDWTKFHSSRVSLRVDQGPPSSSE